MTALRKIIPRVVIVTASLSAGTMVSRDLSAAESGRRQASSDLRPFDRVYHGRMVAISRGKIQYVTAVSAVVTHSTDRFEILASTYAPNAENRPLLFQRIARILGPPRQGPLGRRFPVEYTRKDNQGFSSQELFQRVCAIDGVIGADLLNHTNIPERLVSTIHISRRGRMQIYYPGEYESADLFYQSVAANAHSGEISLTLPNLKLLLTPSPPADKR